MAKEAKSKKRIVVNNYPFELSTRQILKLLSDGKYHTTKGRSDEEPFKSLTKVSPEEIEKYIKDGDDESINRYMEKKRGIPLQQFSALKLLGITTKKSRTTAATYSLSGLGREIIMGLKLIEILKENKMTIDEATQAIEQFAINRDEKEEPE